MLCKRLNFSMTIMFMCSALLIFLGLSQESSQRSYFLWSENAKSAFTLKFDKFVKQDRGYPGIYLLHFDIEFLFLENYIIMHPVS